MTESGDRWFWALVLACPTCAGGVVLAPMLAVGASAVAAKVVLAAAGGGTLLALWGANAWRRRGEGDAEVRGHDPAVVE